MNHFEKQNKQLEKLRGIYFQIGLIIAGGLILVAFEWTSPIYTTTIGGVIIDEIEEDYFFNENFEVIEEEKKVEKIKQPKVDLTKIEIVPDEHIEKKIVVKEEVQHKKELAFNEGNWKEVEKVKEVAPISVAEIMPTFKGGIEKLFEYLGKNIKYPKRDKEVGIQGTVYLQFVVDKKGEIKNVKVLRGVSELIDNEAVRVLKSMPKWTPGKQRGRAVSVLYNLPIKFEIKS